MANLPATQQRDVILDISPPYLAEGTNERYMYNFGLALESLLEKLNQSMKAHMPGHGTPSALEFIGDDRVMAKGPFESDASFTIRLQRAFETWQHAGSRRAVMSQSMVYVSDYVIQSASQFPRCVTVSNDGTANHYPIWDTYYNTSDLSQPPAHVRKSDNNWNWDDSYMWWRAWLIFFIDPSSIIGPDNNWGDPGSWGDGGAWGFASTVTPSFFISLRGIVRLWKSASTYYPWFIFSFSNANGAPGSEFSPNSVQGSGNPAGTFGSWGTTVGGVYASSRPADCRFVDGTAIYQSCYTPTGT